MENKDRTVALYKYVKELCALKYKAVTDIKNQFWHCFLNDIPDDQDNIEIHYRDSVDEETSSNTVLLSVKKPDFEPCPMPPEILIEWLEPGWDRFTNEVRHKDLLTSSPISDNGNIRTNTAISHFNDSEKRVTAYNIWIESRKTWVEKQSLIHRTRRFFAGLFQIYTDLERDSEIYELMIGEGNIRASGQANINHPILLKRVKFNFDAQNNILSIHDTDSEPEIYTILLQDIQNINHGSVKQLIENLQDNFYHPLDRNDSPDYLKILTHTLSSDSIFITDASEAIRSDENLVCQLNPVYFVRRRIDGTLKAIDRIIDNIEDTNYIPGHLLDLVGGGTIEIPVDDHELTIEEQLASLSGESVSVLLAKEANREQLEIAERIEQYNAVLVQGPPGTGKTHTIANLLGHFLAQGKSVLVTSHTKKALTVLKDKIPDEIKDLCVSVLDDTNLDMVRSVDGISEYLSKYTSRELKKKVESASRERLELVKQLAEVRKKLFAIRCSEFEPIVYDGESYTPAQAAKFVNENADTLAYIPGKVQLHHPLPIQINELTQLYRSNVAISEVEEKELENDIPDPKLLPLPAEALAFIEQEIQNQDVIKEIGSKLELEFILDFQNKSISIPNQSRYSWLARNLTGDMLERLSQFISSFKSIDGWMIHAAVDGRRNGGYRDRWSRLIASIEDTASFADSMVANILGQEISFNEYIDLTELHIQIKKLTEIFQKKGRITRFDLLLNKQLELALTQVKINNRTLISAKDSQLVDDLLTLIGKRKDTALLWNELVAKYGLPEFFTLGNAPEQIGLQIIPAINRYLDWYKNDYTYLNELLEKSGLNKDLIFDYADIDSDITKTEKALTAVHKIIPMHLAISKCFLELLANFDRKNQIINEMIFGKRKGSTTCIAVADAIKNNNYELYEQTYNQICELFPKYSLKKARLEALQAIETVAPIWADAIRNRQGIHGDTVCPQSIEDAWKWKQFVGIIEDITSEPFEELQNNAVSIGAKLRNVTSKVAANSAWFHLVARTERNIDMKQALHGWKLTVKKIGKGTGKNAPALKRQARDLMAKCQSAVPAWIMTVNKALDSLDPSKNIFDVIIIDEASQSDVSSLGILYMAKKVIIVGDDKQVSPMAVGVDLDKMNALREMHIKDAIPNWHLYDAKTSLYDIASTTFQPLMLREHFRCVPDIIGYSNKLSYDFKIKPLRDASTSKISPSIVKYRVEDGQRDGRQKTNKKEAEAVVAFMMACMEQKEYEGMSFGAISLLGDEQAAKMQQIILQKIEPSIIEKRQILCGNASHFQGDERDVVFLSLVDSNEGDGPLSKAGEGADQSRKQRYNVAASRARDQLWVIHSLDYTRDLQSGDLRRDLLEYADNPNAYDQLASSVKAHSESPFEEAVGKSLVAAGYHIVQQWQVGAYRIDMVALFESKKVAIECDGDRFHNGDEKIRADMERQAILERIGWRFIRIRGSEYYRNPEIAMNRIYHELNEFDIWPENVIEPQTPAESSELISRVKIRAAQILDGWFAENDGEEPLAVPITPIMKKPFGGFKRETPVIKPITSAPLEKPQQIQLDDVIPTMRPPVQYPKQPEKKFPEKQITQSDSTLSADSLINSLKKSGVKYIDKRDNGGALWIIGGHELDSQIREYKNKGIIFTFKPGGGKATGHKDAWWTK